MDGRRLRRRVQVNEGRGATLRGYQGWKAHVQAKAKKAPTAARSVASADAGERARAPLGLSLCAAALDVPVDVGESDLVELVPVDDADDCAASSVWTADPPWPRGTERSRS